MSPVYVIQTLEYYCVSVRRNSVNCVLQTFVPDLDVIQWHSARTGGGHAPEASGEADFGDVDQGDCCCRTFSDTIPLHVCSCVLDPCPCISTHCLIVALLACVLVPGIRAPGLQPPCVIVVLLAVVSHCRTLTYVWGTCVELSPE